MKANLTLVALAGILAMVQYSAPAQIEAQDSASSSAYSDGWQIGDNGGTGFSPWNLLSIADGIVEHSILDATSVGFNSVMNTSGSAFHLSHTRVSGSGAAQASRSWTGGNTSDLLRVDMQVVSSGTSFTGVISVSGDSGLLMARVLSESPELRVSLGSGQLSTGIGWNRPVRVLFQLINTTTCRIRIQTLNAPVITFDSGNQPTLNPASNLQTFYAGVMTISPPATTRLVFNNLIYDAGGDGNVQVPVHISAFELD